MKKLLFSAVLAVVLSAFADDKLGSSKASEVGFEKGTTALTASNMDEVKKAIDEAKTMGPIKEVKIIAWADREYPVDGEKATKDSVKLAEDRADTLKKYLKDTLKVKPVKTYNMASRPNTLQEVFKTSQAKVKDNMEKSGTAPASNDTGFMGVNAKASSALVLIYTKGNPNKL